MTGLEALKTLGYQGSGILSLQDAKSRYRKLSKETHPDVAGGSHELFKALQDAFEVVQGLGDGFKYDFTKIRIGILQGASLMSYTSSESGLTYFYNKKEERFW